MNAIKSNYEIWTVDNLQLNGELILKHIERCGRVCYKSEDRITEDSAKLFVKKILDSQHESVVEHFSFTVKFTIDRGVSHEIVRHRIASFSQESTRYCNYTKDKFGNALNVIDITEHMKTDEAKEFWQNAMEYLESTYNELIRLGETPQIARSVLPNSLKTEIVVTCNLREWREIFRQRTAKAAHPQMREIMIPLLAEMKTLIPIVFDDIEPNR